MHSYAPSFVEDLSPSSPEARRVASQRATDMVREIATAEALRTPPAAATRRPASEQRGRDLLAGAELSRDATQDVFIYDLDSNIPIRDVEQGLLGLFSVFGTVTSTMALPGNAPHSCSVLDQYSHQRCAGARGTLQAVVSYTDSSAAEQAMERLQNFEIWGRPLRLAYARLQGDAASPSSRARPSTAPHGTRKQASENQFERGGQEAAASRVSPSRNLEPEAGRRAVQNASWSESSDEEEEAEEDGKDLDVGGMSDLSISPSNERSPQNQDFANALSDLLSSAMQPRQPSRGEQIVQLDDGGEEGEGDVSANEEDQDQAVVDPTSAAGSMAEKVRRLPGCCVCASCEQSFRS
eukprot:3604036-Rhodomonas_salina.2